MDIEKKLFEFALKGYHVLRTPTHMWFTSDACDTNYKSDLFYATYASNISIAILKLEYFIKQNGY